MVFNLQSLLNCANCRPAGMIYTWAPSRKDMTNARDLQSTGRDLACIDSDAGKCKRVRITLHTCVDPRGVAGFL
jgi:hypothetical protein